MDYLMALWNSWVTTEPQEEGTLKRRVSPRQSLAHTHASQIHTDAVADENAEKANTESTPCRATVRGWQDSRGRPHTVARRRNWVHTHAPYAYDGSSSANDPKTFGRRWLVRLYTTLDEFGVSAVTGDVVAFCLEMTCVFNWQKHSWNEQPESVRTLQLTGCSVVPALHRSDKTRRWLEVTLTSNPSNALTTPWLYEDDAGRFGLTVQASWPEGSDRSCLDAALDLFDAGGVTVTAPERFPLYRQTDLPKEAWAMAEEPGSDDAVHVLFALRPDLDTNQGELGRPGKPPELELTIEPAAQSNSKHRQTLRSTFDDDAVPRHIWHQLGIESSEPNLHARLQLPTSSLRLVHVKDHLGSSFRVYRCQIKWLIPIPISRS